MLEELSLLQWSAAHRSSSNAFRSRAFTVIRVPCASRALQHTGPSQHRAVSKRYALDQRIHQGIVIATQILSTTLNTNNERVGKRMDYVIRFLIGGAVVSSFALLGDVIRPKSFAGIFGAAPSVALATLALTLKSQGAPYTAIEARSMMIGAAATGVYAWMCTRVMWRAQASIRVITILGLVVWAATAFLGWFCLSRMVS